MVGTPVDFGTCNFQTICQDLAVLDETQQRWTNEGKDFFLGRMMQKHFEHPFSYEQLPSGKTTPEDDFVMKDREKSRQEHTAEVFQMNAKGFEPEEVCVKIKDGLLCVTAKHIEGNPSGENCVLKEIEQEFQIPEGIDPESVRCQMNSDGMLSFRAPPVTACIRENYGSTVNDISINNICQ